MRQSIVADITDILIDMHSNLAKRRHTPSLAPTILKRNAFAWSTMLRQSFLSRYGNSRSSRPIRKMVESSRIHTNPFTTTPAALLERSGCGLALQLSAFGSEDQD